MTKMFGQYREGGLSPGAGNNLLHLFLTELHVKMLHKYVCTQQQKRIAPREHTTTALFHIQLSHN